MRELRNTKIIAVDHGYGNMKTANTVTQPESKPMKQNHSSASFHISHEECCKLVLSTTITGNLIIRIFSR